MQSKQTKHNQNKRNTIKEKEIQSKPMKLNQNQSNATKTNEYRLKERKHNQKNSEMKGDGFFYKRNEGKTWILTN